VKQPSHSLKIVTMGGTGVQGVVPRTHSPLERGWQTPLAWIQGQPRLSEGATQAHMGVGVGDNVGSLLGKELGEELAVGSLLGKALGLALGAGLSPALGDDVGALVGDGDVLGEAVGL
jgi:hypothetical protein